MHTREAREEQQHASRRADGGTIAPATGLDRRRPRASPPARPTTAASAAASAAVAALVERREDEVMSDRSISTKRSREGKGIKLLKPLRRRLQTSEFSKEME